MGPKSVLRKFVTTTDSKHTLPIADNELDRNFKSGEPAKKWVSDITYLRADDNWCYLTTIMDLADRKITGRALSEDMTTENTVRRAWVDACRTRTVRPLYRFKYTAYLQLPGSSNEYITWYNTKRLHSSSGYLSPLIPCRARPHTTTIHLPTKPNY